MGSYVNIQIYLHYEGVVPLKEELEECEGSSLSLIVKVMKRFWNWLISPPPEDDTSWQW